MSEISLIKANTDLGVNKTGAELGPGIICDNLELTDYNSIINVNKPDCIKDISKENLKKNINEINVFNNELYLKVLNSLENDELPFVLGGDHSIAIGSALASKKYNGNIGLIWFDAHADFNTFDTTITGNIHGLPFATIAGQNGTDLCQFFDGTFYDPQKCVLIGARSIDMPLEYENLKKAGITIFTSSDIKNNDINSIIDEAIKIVTTGTDGFHLSIDTDVIDPLFAPGVSVPESYGISDVLFEQITSLFMKYKECIKSIDFVEYNPKYDIDNRTLDIVTNSINLIINELENLELAKNKISIPIGIHKQK